MVIDDNPAAAVRDVLATTEALMKANKALRDDLGETITRTRALIGRWPALLPGGSSAKARAAIDLLRQRVRLMLKVRRLPSLSSGSAWGGQGDGGACAVCDAVLEAGQRQYCVDTAKGRLCAHVPCYLAWGEESARRENPNGSWSRTARPPR